MQDAILKYLSEKIAGDLGRTTPLTELSEELRTVLKYLSSEIIEDLRRGLQFSDELYHAIDEHPLIDFVREGIRDSDKAIVTNMIRSDNMFQRKLGVVLARNLQSDDDIHMQDSMKNVLLETWDLRKDFDTRFNLMWHLLDFEKLSAAKHKEIFQFVIDNWGEIEFRNDISWCGCPKTKKGTELAREKTLDFFS